VLALPTDTWGTWFLDLMPGLLISLQLTGVLLIIGLPLGTLFALGMGSRHRALRYAVTGVVEIARGIPALVLLYLVYFGLPQIDLGMDAFLSAAAALGVSFGAYSSAAIRSGLDAVPAGQREAARALGLHSGDEFFRVVLPQALRIITPPLLGWAIIYFQATSLAFAIAVPELLSRAYTLAVQNFQYFTLLGMAALIYAAISIPASLFSDYLANRRTVRAQT
jgi:polar amino acid transport system permease protein